MILVVIPAYNEEKNIGRVLRDLFEHGYKNIVVVDDGSNDNTGLKVLELGVDLITHPINRGQGAALETGNEYARLINAKTVIHFDADGQFNTADIKNALQLIDQGYDIILGSRFLDKRSKIPFFKKYFILPIARMVNYFESGLKLTDAHNGFRVMNYKALDKIRFSQDGMAHNSEVISLIKNSNLSYIEIPVEVFYNEYGQGISGGIKIIRDLLISKMIR